jgi:hypothetical protein
MFVFQFSYVCSLSALMNVIPQISHLMFEGEAVGFLSRAITRI